MEFRDANRRLFNTLNIPECCDHRPIAPPFYKIKGKSWWTHCKKSCKREQMDLKCIGTVNSTNCTWFDHLENSSPLYDITAYLLMRDKKTFNCLYCITKVDEHIYEVGRSKSDIRNKETYITSIANEIKEFVNN